LSKTLESFFKVKLIARSALAMTMPAVVSFCEPDLHCEFVQLLTARGGSATVHRQLMKYGHAR